MGNLVHMSDFRQKRRAKWEATGPSASKVSVYYCVGCGLDRFILSPLGAICCGNCGAIMHNLQVSESKNINNGCE
jgi:hypothetical protein